MSHYIDVDSLKTQKQENDLFIEDTIDYSIINFIKHNFSHNFNVEFGDIYEEKSQLCSHANSCKYKKDGDTINSCKSTGSCQYFCQEFISVSHQKVNSKHYKNLLNEAVDAKKEKRLRRDINS